MVTHGQVATANFKEAKNAVRFIISAENQEYVFCEQILCMSFALCFFPV